MAYLVKSDLFVDRLAQIPSALLEPFQCFSALADGDGDRTAVFHPLQRLGAEILFHVLRGIFDRVESGKVHGVDLLAKAAHSSKARNGPRGRIRRSEAESGRFPRTDHRGIVAVRSEKPLKCPR